MVASDRRSPLSRGARSKKSSGPLPLDRARGGTGARNSRGCRVQRVRSASYELKRPGGVPSICHRRRHQSIQRYWHMGPRSNGRAPAHHPQWRALEVATDDFRDVGSTGITGNTGNDDGRFRAFNDAGQLAFYSSGIGGGVSNAATIPEPDSFLLLTVWSLILCGTKRRSSANPSHAYRPNTASIEFQIPHPVLTIGLQIRPLSPLVPRVDREYLARLRARPETASPRPARWNNAGVLLWWMKLNG